MKQEKINFMLGQKWDHTPTGSDIAKANNAHRAVSMTLEELAQKITNGYSFRPAILKKGLNSKNWTGQQLFVLSFDACGTIKSVDQLYELYCNLEIKPNFIYTTMDKNNQISKFIIIFCANEEILSASLRDKLQATLMGLATNCDVFCRDKTRFFYGTKRNHLYYTDYDARISVKFIIENYWANVEQFTKYLPRIHKEKQPRYLVTERIKGINLQNSINAISSLDVKAFKNSHKNISYEYISDISLYDYLRIPEDEYYQCIPSSNDGKSWDSLHFYHEDCVSLSVTPSSFYLIQSFNEAKSLDIIELTCKLAGCTNKKAIAFLNDIYEIKYPYLYNREFYHITLDYRELAYSKEYINLYPNLHKLLKEYEIQYLFILCYITKKLNFSYDKNINPFLFFCFQKLLNTLSSSDVSNDMVDIIHLLHYLGFFCLYNYSEMPITNKKSYQEWKMTQNDVCFFQIKPFTDDLLQKAEKIAKTIIKSNLDIHSLNTKFITSLI